MPSADFKEGQGAFILKDIPSKSRKDQQRRGVLGAMKQFDHKDDHKAFLALRKFSWETEDG